MLTLKDSDEEAAFREEVVRFTAQIPEHLRWSNRFEDLVEIDKRLAGAGLMCISWPEEYGGRGMPQMLEAVLTDELGRVGIRRAESPSHQGVNNLAPALIQHGSDEQKQHLARIRAVDELWCQGFSEPDAGSDLANVRMTAQRDGSTLVINGSKLWTSGADHADWIFLLVRTGPVDLRHKALSFVLAPMTSPGITVHPIEKITGARMAHPDGEFCQVFFDDVSVPDDAVVGGFGNGWGVAMTLLSSERLSGRYRYATFRHELKQLAIQLTDDGKRAIPAGLAREFGKLVAEIEGMGALSLRVDSSSNTGKDPHPLPSVNKLWWPRAHQRLYDFALRASIELGLEPDQWYRGWLESRPESIYGGSAQIQRNILAERALNMPRGRR